MFSQSRLGLPGKCADGGVPSPSPGSAIEPVAYPVPAPRGSLCLPGRRCLADERLAADTDDAGFVILQLMNASIHDFNDIMTLCSRDAHWGALKLLRCAFERTVTL